jgi:hypothetical protein
MKMNISVATGVGQQTFPFGTVAGSWRWRLLKSDGSFVTEQYSTNPLPPTVTFPNVNPGVYKVEASRMNQQNSLALGTPVTSDPLTVPDPGVNIEIPNSVTLTLV